MPRRAVNKKQAKQIKKTKDSYRNMIPRTISLATRRNFNQTLRFVLNQSWVLDPTVLGDGKTLNLQYGANTVFKSHIPTAAATSEACYKSQDPQLYSNSVQTALFQAAEGYSDWKDRYQHFCVVGSKITYTWEPIGTGCPCVLYCHLSGVTPSITETITSAQINKFPYTNRHSISSIGVSSPKSAGIRGSMNYSTRKFEGVTDPHDNTNLRGRFGNSNAPGGLGLDPGEQSYFTIAMAPVDPATDTKMPGGVLRVKVEYITFLKEPTESNQVQVHPKGHYDPRSGG